MSRRTLIRRLVAGGVSLGAAVSYAQVLNPQRAGATGTLAADDHYPAVDLTIVSTSLATVRTEKRVRVRIDSSEELQQAFFEVFVRTGGGLYRLGARSDVTFLSAAGSRSVYVSIDRTRLAGRTKARIYVYFRARDGEPLADHPGHALATGTTLLT